jgi:hypothetical protein
MSNRSWREGNLAGGVAARKAVNAAGPAVRKAHRVYAARIAAVDQPLPPGN